MANPVGGDGHQCEVGPKEEEECSSAHDITSLSDLPGRRMKTKLWPMSPIESLSAEEVMEIANRDQTPVLIAVMEGDGSGEKYLCGNKKGVTLPPEVAAEGSWAQKYYQQVAVLNNSLKEMQEKFLPVWELAKSQQALLVSVEIFDGLLAVANQGFQLLYKSWSIEDMNAIITRDCDFRVFKQVHYYSVLKNYTMGKFGSLEQFRLKSVEDLLLAGESYLVHHAQANGFQCPQDIRALFQEFLPLKRDRNEYSHPLTLARKQLACSVLQKLRASVSNDEFEFVKGTKNMILLGADYAESILQSYGKVRPNLFLDPKRRSKKRPRSNDHSSDESPLRSPPQTRGSPQAMPLNRGSFQIGQSSQSSSLTFRDPQEKSQRSQQSPNPQTSSRSRSPSLGNPHSLPKYDSSETLQRPQLSIQVDDSQCCEDPASPNETHLQSLLNSPSFSNSPSLETSLSNQSSPQTQKSDTPQTSPVRNSKRPRQ